MPPGKNIEFLRDNYGVFTGHLRGIYGVNAEDFENESNERGLYILQLIDLYPYITKEEMAIILDCSLSSIEKSMQKARKQVLISRKGSDKTGAWTINKL